MPTMTPAFAYTNKDLSQGIRSILYAHAIQREDLNQYTVDIAYIEDQQKVEFVILINGDDYYCYAECGQAIDQAMERSYSNHAYDAGDRWTAPAGGGTFEDHKENVTDEMTRAWLFSHLNQWTLEA